MGERARSHRMRRGEEAEFCLPGAALEVERVTRSPLARGPGPLRADIQSPNRRRLRADAENIFLERVGVHDGATCGPKKYIVKARAAADDAAFYKAASVRAIAMKTVRRVSMIRVRKKAYAAAMSATKIAMIANAAIKRAENIGGMWSSESDGYR